MTNNEKIAKWLGWRPPDGHLPRGSWSIAWGTYFPTGEQERWIHRETSLSVSPEEMEASCMWTDLFGGCFDGAPIFDNDITLWHGENGLLAEIEKNEKIGSFLDALMVAHAWDVDGRWRHDFVWLIRCAEPAQLAAALVKMIDNG